MSWGLGGWLSWLLVGVCGGGLLSWNLSELIWATPQIRMTDRLDFLPDPKVAKMLSFGHPGSVSKLRLIDSYTYFSWVVDSKDDSSHASGGKGGMERLYEQMIEQDPRFMPFYLKGGSAVGGIVGDHLGEMRLLLRGLLQYPHATELWAYLAAVLAVHYDWEERRPQDLEALLNAWAEAELAKPDGRPRLAQDWLTGIGRRQERNTAQLFYWGQQLLFSRASGGVDTGSERIREQMREQLAMYQRAQLQRLVELAVAAGRWQPDWGAVLAPPMLRQLYASEAAVAGPAEPFVIDPDSGAIGLRFDPYGLPWQLQAAQVESLGLAMQHAERRLAVANRRLYQRSLREDRWPRDLDEALAWADWQEPLPALLGLIYRDERLHLRLPPAGLGGEPWPETQLLAAAGLAPDSQR